MSASRICSISRSLSIRLPGLPPRNFRHHFSFNRQSTVYRSNGRVRRGSYKTDGSVEWQNHGLAVHRHIRIHGNGLGRHVLPARNEACRLFKLLRNPLQFGRSGQHVLPHALEGDRTGMGQEDTRRIHIRCKSSAIMLRSQLCCFEFWKPPLIWTGCNLAPHNDSYWADFHFSQRSQPMFTQLVKNPLTLARYRNGPFAQERGQYLTHLSQQGYGKGRLTGINI